MPKFKHYDEDEDLVYCDLCQYEHDAGIPESVCRKNANKSKDRLLEEQRDQRWDREEQKRQDWE